jgi:hypothetical protein
VLKATFQRLLPHTALTPPAHLAVRVLVAYPWVRVTQVSSRCVPGPGHQVSQAKRIRNAVLGLVTPRTAGHIFLPLPPPLLYDAQVELQLTEFKNALPAVSTGEKAAFKAMTPESIGHLKLFTKALAPPEQDTSGLFRSDILKREFLTSILHRGLKRSLSLHLSLSLGSERIVSRQCL